VRRLQLGAAARAHRDAERDVDARATASSTPTASPQPSPTATASPSPLRTPLACADLAGALGGATIRGAELVPAAGNDPQFCRVTGMLETTLNVERRLPDAWRQTVLFIGGGGYDGVVPVPNDGTANADALRRGYATIATDSGHSGSVLDASWALDDPEAVQNFAFRAWHTVLLAAREIITAYYAAPIRRTYFQGGSSGGREALIMAQRWPDDCDGVIARAPALSFVATMLAANRLAKHVYATPGGHLPAATTEALGRAVLDACDGLDGLADGMVSDVEGCQFDAGALRCSGPPTDDCLTDAQLATVRAVHSAFAIPVPLANGVSEYPRYPVGGEESWSGWPLWISGASPAPPSSLLFILSDGFVKFFVTRDPDFDSFAFAPQDHAALLTSLSALLDATEPDLSAFAARGGKVMLWHGWSDYALSAFSTVAYYERVVGAGGGQRAAGAFVLLHLARRRPSQQRRRRADLRSARRPRRLGRGRRRAGRPGGVQGAPGSNAPCRSVPCADTRPTRATTAAAIRTGPRASPARRRDHPPERMSEPAVAHPRPAPGADRAAPCR
jgi:feruloyl esterase